MRLKIFDNNSRSANHGCRVSMRSIGVSLKTGGISFSVMLQKGMGLTHGGRVLFAQDEDSGDWFIAKTDAETGIMLRTKKNGGWAKAFTSVYFCNRLISEKLLASCKAKASATFLIAEKPTKVDGQEWYKIVTSKPLRSK